MMALLGVMERVCYRRGDDIFRAGEKGALCALSLPLLLPCTYCYSLFLL